jgi:hypothetical protein
MNDNTHTAAELIPAVIENFMQAVIEAQSPKPPEPIRILLSEAASKHLDATGENAFAVVARGSWPDSPGRWVIYLLPCDIPTADAACRVARGISKERRLKI